MEVGANPPPPIQDVEERLAKLKGARSTDGSGGGGEAHSQPSSLPPVCLCLYVFYCRTLYTLFSFDYITLYFALHFTRRNIILTSSLVSILVVIQTKRLTQQEETDRLLEEISAEIEIDEKLSGGRRQNTLTGIYLKI